MDSLQEAKKRLRKELRDRRNALSIAEMESGSKTLCQRLAEFQLLGNITHLMAYLSHGREISCDEYLTQRFLDGKEVILPRINFEQQDLELFSVRNLDHLREGWKQIREPDPALAKPVVSDQIQAILLPGIAFDLAGRRLGQGGGYYDRLLEQIDTGCQLIGLAYDWQIIERVPTEPFDKTVHWIATPSGIHKCDPLQG